MDDPGFESRQGYGVFSKMSRMSLGLIQPRTQWYLGSFQRVKWTGSEGDHSSPTSAEVKNGWSCTSVPPIFRHGVDKHNCTFDGLGGRGIRFPAVASHFSMGTGNLSPKVKWPRRVDDHIHLLPRLRLRECSYTSPSPYVPITPTNFNFTLQPKNIENGGTTVLRKVGDHLTRRNIPEYLNI